MWANVVTTYSIIQLPGVAEFRMVQNQQHLTCYVYVINQQSPSVWSLMLMSVLIQLCCDRCEGARQSIYKVRVKYQLGVSKNTDHSLEV